MFLLSKGFSKLLVCGGWPGIDTCEVINLESSAKTCKNPPNFPVTVWTASGGLGFKGNPIICGGYQDDSLSSSCYSLSNNQWVSSDRMNSKRSYYAAAQWPNGKLLVTGGWDQRRLKSAEILTEQGWESNIPSLPVTIADHCMVTINSTTVMAIGGNQNDQISGKTFYFTFGEASWTEGPDLKNKRYAPSCGQIRREKDSQGKSVIVAGGAYGSTIWSSVEILDEGSNEWQTGPELPFGIDWSQMVEDQNGGVVLIGGKSSTVDNLDTLYQLPHGGQDAVWTKMEQKMKTGRYWHTAFMLPDNIVDCS